MMDIEDLRTSIDDADEALLDALARRMKLIEQISQVKLKRGLPVFDAERERLIIERLAERAVSRGLDISLVEAILRRIIAHSRTRQAHARSNARADGGQVGSVAYQGAPGAYSWLAVRARFGDGVRSVGCRSFAEAFELLRTEQVDRAVLPVQNSIAGSIHEVYSLLASSGAAVVGEQFVRVDHCLIGLHGAEAEAVTDVYSHPVALRQCEIFLRGSNGIRCHAFVDTAEAVLKVREDGLPTGAAIASREAAELHGLAVLRTGLSDRPDNMTRFWTIAREPQPVELSTPARTSLYLIVDHREGALVEALAILAERGINMTKLESHPLSGVPWEFAFYLDVDASIDEQRMQAALSELEGRAAEVRLLGCYPRDGGYV
jgi:chorismate mutase / prephenate dehydratase